MDSFTAPDRLDLFGTIPPGRYHTMNCTGEREEAS